MRCVCEGPVFGRYVVRVTEPWTNLPDESIDIWLVVADMDGTLLTPEGEIPPGFADQLRVMTERGITFVPASGRQFAMLERLFPASEHIAHIAENGNLVVRGGKPIRMTAVDGPTVRDVVTVSREAAESIDLGLVVCGLESAYIERTTPAFVQEVENYYAKLTIVEDLTTVEDRVLKLAVYDFADAQVAAHNEFARFAQTHQVVVSGKHWIDIMDRDINKGIGVRALQAELGVSPAQTVVFGDYLNDLEMMDDAQWSFAMANGHPDVKERASYLAPSNAERGVVHVLTRLLS